MGGRSNQEIGRNGCQPHANVAHSRGVYQRWNGTGLHDLRNRCVECGQHRLLVSL